MKFALIALSAVMILAACDKVPNSPVGGTGKPLPSATTDAENVYSPTPTTTAPAAMKTFTVTLEAPADAASPLSPGVFIVHRGGMQIFSMGQKDRGQGLEAQAEDGNPATLAAAIPSAMVFNTPVGDSKPGPATPGKKFQFSFSAQPGDYLSFTTMFGQSNDAFYAPADMGIPLFNGNSPIVGDMTSKVILWDAGTEMNQEPGKGADQAPRQAGANTGASESEAIVPIAERKDGFSYGQSLRLMIEAK